MAAGINYSAMLNNLVQNRCRTNPFIHYNVRGSGLNYHCSLRIGTRVYVGPTMLSQYSARQAAAHVALNDLENRNEPDMRKRLGMPPRPHVQEMDEVRDVLRGLRARTNNELTIGARVAARGNIGRFYDSVDALERALLNMGLNQSP